MPRFPFRHRRKPRDLYPEILQRLRDEEAARAAAPRPPLGSFAASLDRQINETAAAVADSSTQHPPETETETETQTAPPNPKSAPPPEQTSKEIQPMPSTILTQAKSALRAAAAPPSPSPKRSRTAAAKTKSSKSSLSDNPDLDRHSRKCLVCNHPDREAIEDLFVGWHSPQSIYRDFGPRGKLDWSSIYRHAHATGLYARRRENLRAVLDLLLEKAGQVEPTAQGIVAVVRAYSCLTDTHQWVEPERRVHVTNHIYHHSVPAEPDLSADTAAPLCHDHGIAVSNTAAPETSSEPVSVTSAGDPPNHASVSVSGTQSLRSAANPVPRAGSSLVTGHSPLPSNRQPSRLASPPTRT
jgi:hypothetical protein